MRIEGISKDKKNETNQKKNYVGEKLPAMDAYIKKTA